MAENPTDLPISKAQYEAEEAFERMLASAGEKEALAYFERKHLTQLVADIVKDGMTDERRKTLDGILKEGGVPFREAEALVKNLDAVSRGQEPVHDLMVPFLTKLDEKFAEAKARVMAGLGGSETAEPAATPESKSSPAASVSPQTIGVSPRAQLRKAPAKKEAPAQEPKDWGGAIVAFVSAVVVAVMAVFNYTPKHSEGEKPKDDTAEKAPSASSKGDAGAAPSASAPAKSEAPTPKAAERRIIEEESEVVLIKPARAEAALPPLERKKQALAYRAQSEAKDGAAGFGEGVYEGMVSQIQELSKQAKTPEQVKVLENALDKLNLEGLTAKIDGRTVTDKELDAIDLAMKRDFDAAQGHTGKAKRSEEPSGLQR